MPDTHQSEAADARSALDLFVDPALDPLFTEPPRFGVPSAWYGHVPFATWLIRALRPRMFVELGSHNGVSYAAFCQAALESGLDVKGYAVDTWRGDEHAGFYDESVYTDLAAFHDRRYAGFSRLLRMTFDEACKGFEDGSIDLLHIDGLHTRDAVAHDFECWRPKLSERAVVLFHDTNVRERDFGVWRYWSELRQRHPSFEFVHGHGLGVLAVGPALDGPVRALCNLADPAEIATLRSRFARSGQRCIDLSDQASQRGEWEEKLRRSEQALAEAHDATERERASAERERAAPIEHEKTAGEVSTTVADAAIRRSEQAQNEAERLHLIAIELENRAVVVRGTLAERERDLGETRERLVERGAEITARQQEIAAGHQEIAAGHQEIARRDRRIGELMRYEEEYRILTQSTMWRTLAPVRNGLARLPHRAIRRAIKGALWAATPWSIPARLQRRRAFIAHAEALRLAALLPPPVIIPPPPAPPPPPPPPAPPPPPFDRFSLDHIAKPGQGYFPLIESFDPVAPEVSIVILNWNGGDMTLLCLQHLWQHTRGHHYEIIVVDNGSGPAEVARLEEEAPFVQIVPLGGNRYFGEANNLGVEAAKGRYVCLLNNDAFVSPGWLPPLVRLLAEDATVGAVSPRFLYPDGSLQEAGGLVDPDGSVIQLGKGADLNDPQFGQDRTVDYVSAACVVLRRDDFIRVLGFDLAWDPAYYEDVDLCLKLRLIGLRSVCCAASTIVHIENATSTNKGASLQLGNIVAINRAKFVGRWGPYLRTAGQEQPPLIPTRPVALTPAPSADETCRVVIFTPFQLTPGGGERYILTIAEALKDVALVSLVTPYRLSRLRLLTMAREFGIDLDQVELLRPEELMLRRPADVGFLLGNEILPPMGRIARHTVHICQFPFPFENPLELRRRLPFWREMELIVTYSEFVRAYAHRAIKETGVPYRPIEVLAPPVPMINDRADKRRGQILHVGRFFTGDHCKRQDALIEALRLLLASGVEAELHLAGSTMPEAKHRAYYAALREQAAGLPVHFHTNCSVEALHRLYAESDLYWHATGFGQDISVSPHVAEHFGISVVEAMSARCIPIVFAAGGPATVVEEGLTGFHFETLEDLAERSRTLLESTGSAELNVIRDASEAAAHAYDEETFRTKIRAIVTRLNVPASAPVDRRLIK